MEVELKLVRATLFECEKVRDNSVEEGYAINSARAVGNKVFDLTSNTYTNLKRTLTLNIKRKIDAEYSKDLSKKDKRDSFKSGLFPEANQKGRKAISLAFNLEGDPQNSILEKLLQSNESSFRQNCATFANKYMENKDDFKGVLGIVQFELEFNERKEKFISIVTSDFSEAISTDDEEAIKYLDKIFDEKFKTIIIYPFPEEDSQGELCLYTNKAKTHQRSGTTDPDIFVAAQLSKPEDPQKIMKAAYDNGFNLEEIYKKLKEVDPSYPKKAKIDMHIGNSNFKVNFEDFYNSFELISESPKGEGLFIHGDSVDAKIGKKRNFLRDRKMRKTNLKDLKDKIDNKETERDNYQIDK